MTSICLYFIYQYHVGGISLRKLNTNWWNLILCFYKDITNSLESHISCGFNKFLTVNKIMKQKIGGGGLKVEYILDVSICERNFCDFIRWCCNFLKLMPHQNATLQELRFSKSKNWLWNPVAGPEHHFGEKGAPNTFETREIFFLLIHLKFFQNFQFFLG